MRVLNVFGTTFFSTFMRSTSHVGASNMCTTDTLRTSSHPQQPTMPVHALFKRTFDQEANKLYSPLQIFVISRKKKQKCNENCVAYCSRVLSVYRHLGQAFKTQMVRDCSQPQFYSFPDWYKLLCCQYRCQYNTRHIILIYMTKNVDNFSLKGFLA